MNKNIKVCILGTGSMGTSLARLVSNNGYEVKMWGIDKEAVDNINNYHENKKFLPEIKLNNKTTSTLQLSEALQDSKVVIVAVPSQVVDKVFSEVKLYLQPDQIILSASKGIEMVSGLTISNVIKKYLPHTEYHNLAVLMGPLFASELSTDVPTVGLIAAPKIATFKILKNILQSPTFFVRFSSDVLGAELGGALKNVYAIILGVCDGLGYGWNTKSAAMTAAVKEMALVGQYLGGKKETFYGLAGLGDLLTTGFGEKSRNRRFGEKICSGSKIEDVIKDIGQVVEGASTVKVVCRLLEGSNKKTPLLNSVAELVNDHKDPCQMMHKILEKVS
ncbi:MAG: NAD(P)H-dependent glycerol-3-phosphate dehydrogenase [Candidatus Magasanikbacteria bacterium]|nr:NAD(P)H-dependent glycerol-3-phosphate dehydrogenase [Candidatus Magasanikbacteria bacterium]